MKASERWRRATFYAAVTALLIGLAALLLTIGSMHPTYIRTSALTFVVSVGILLGLSVVWYWVLKLVGK